MKKLKTFWFYQPRSLRFLIIGGLNTSFSFGLFCLFAKLSIAYALTLIMTYIVSIFFSIYTMKHLVYQSSAPTQQIYVKGWLSYLSALALNYLFLYILIDILHFNTISSQFIYTALSSYYLYIIHQKFTFSGTKHKS